MVMIPSMGQTGRTSSTAKPVMIAYTVAVITTPSSAVRVMTTYEVAMVTIPTSFLRVTVKIPSRTMTQLKATWIPSASAPALNQPT